MAGRLKPGNWRRRLLWAALLWGVLLGHLWLGGKVAQLHEDWRELAEMPPRLQVAFVRSLQPAPAPRPKPAPRLQQAAPASAHLPAQGAASFAKPAEPLPVLAAPPAEPERLQPVPVLPFEQAEAFDPGPEWPASTQLDYRLIGNYRGEVHGSAQVQWLRQGRRYQVHLDVAIGPRFAPLISRRMSSEGELTPQGIAPRRYDEDTRILFSDRRRLSLLFEPGSLQFPGGRREAAPAGVQDTASQFVQLSWLFLTGRVSAEPGRAVELPLALPRKLYRWRYELLGEELLDMPFGPLKTWHLRPTVQNTGGDLKAEVWLAPTLQYLPVRLRIVQDEQTYIDLMLSQPPLQAAEPIVQPNVESQSKESP